MFDIANILSNSTCYLRKTIATSVYRNDLIHSQLSFALMGPWALARPLHGVHPQPPVSAAQAPEAATTWERGRALVSPRGFVTVQVQTVA